MPTITIDNLIKKYGLPELIKIDVEGGEYECISSLTQKVKLLCFEWASEVKNITLKCIEHLSKLGFTQFYIQYEDEYSFRPPENEYFDITTLKKYGKYSTQGEIFYTKNLVGGWYGVNNRHFTTKK